jgi:hypothetical protein
MIVDQVHVERIALLEAKDNPPVAGDRDAPKTLQIALQRMKSIAGKRHLLSSISDVQPGEDILDPIELISPDLLPIAAQEQTSQSPMLERSDHALLYGVN